MEIISFTGKSGTGKSYQANRICGKMKIEAIIDDGLLIYKNRIVAGSSAKKCTSKAAAMRTALFNYEKQRCEVMEKLDQLKPKKLMIIGTSDRMVDWITDALELHRADVRFYIEDFTDEEQREIASKTRKEQGEHVIPVPVGQIKKDFAGYFVHPVRMIKGMTMDGPLVSGNATDRTVVRPTFSYNGNFNISENAIKDIIDIAAGHHASCLKVIGYYSNSNSRALAIVIEIKIRRRINIVERIERFQGEVKTAVEKMMAFQVSHVNIIIKEISLPCDAKGKLKKKSKQKPRGEEDKR